jgi:hypothetical protein
MLTSICLSWNKNITLKQSMYRNFLSWRIIHFYTLGNKPINSLIFIFLIIHAELKSLYEMNVKRKQHNAHHHNHYHNHRVDEAVIVLYCKQNLPLICVSRILSETFNSFKCRSFPASLVYGGSFVPNAQIGTWRLSSPVQMETNQSGVRSCQRMIWRLISIFHIGFFSLKIYCKQIRSWNLKKCEIFSFFKFAQFTLQVISGKFVNLLS